MNFGPLTNPFGGLCNIVCDVEHTSFHVGKHMQEKDDNTHIGGIWQHSWQRHVIKHMQNRGDI